jgi:bacterioferritin (cytochrome b1)
VTRKTLSLTTSPLIISVVFLTGCAAWTTPTPASRPYFKADPQDVRSFQALAKKQEILAAKCSESNSCDHAYFTRGLLGLYESREVAEKYFEKVLTVAPKGQFAVSSKGWLDLLRKSAGHGPRSWSQAVLTAPALAETNTLLALAADRLVRDLLEKEALVQQLRASKNEDSGTVETLQRELADRDQKLQSKKDSPKPSADPVSVQYMQKQLAERDRKIEELSMQLEALKRIDQEMREKVRPIRPPLTTIPIPGPETTP